MELNIAYKFYLGSVKDIEDAVYLYCVLNEYIKYEKILNYSKTLGLEPDYIKEYLKCD